MMAWWMLLSGIPWVTSNWWIPDSSVILLLHVDVCGNVSLFRNFSHTISFMANRHFLGVRQHSIFVSMFYGLSYMVDVRISSLVFIIRSSQCYAGPFIGQRNINTDFIHGDGIRRLGRLLRSDITYRFIQDLHY